MIDYFNPLPIKYLKKRFAPLFEVVRSRQSGCFIGLPESAKSGYLKFLLEEKSILNKILKGYGSKYKVLLFEPIQIKTTNLYHWLFQLSVKLEVLDNNYKHRETDDPVILLTNIQKYLIELAKQKKHLTIIISNPQVLSNLDQESAYVLKAIWDTYRKPPCNPCSLIFLLYSKSPFFDKLSNFFIPLKDILIENIIYFTTLNKHETYYTIERLSQFYKVELDNKEKKLIYSLTGGLYFLIMNSIKIINSLKIKHSVSLIKSLINNKEIYERLHKLWNSFGELHQTNLKKINKGIKETNNEMKFIKNLGLVDSGYNFRSEWFRSFIFNKKYKKIKEDIEIPIGDILSGKEYLIFNKLLLRGEKTVSKEEVAKILWGRDYMNRYSDWAIDKTISRIRKKLKDKNKDCSIITIKNQGYVLIK